MIKYILLIVFFIFCTQAFANTLQKGIYTGQKAHNGIKGIKEGVPVEYELYLSEGFRNDGTDALVVMGDYLWLEAVKAMEECVRQKQAPAFAAVGLTPNNLEPTLPGGTPRAMRKDQYDLAIRDFVDFLVDEMLPAIMSKHNFTVSANPDMHYIMGGSSGAVFSWIGCWYRNEYFHRCYMASPTFSAINMGEELPFLIRKLEPRNIKVLLTTGGIEPDDYFGASYPVALNTERALNFAGYDYEYREYKEEGHCSRCNHYESQLEYMKCIWKDWDTVPVSHPRLCARLSELVGGKSGWKETNEKFPSHPKAVGPAGEYKASGSKIYLYKKDGTKELAAKGFGDISQIAVSADNWKLIIADRGSNFVYSMNINPDGRLNLLLKLCPLHIAPDAHRLGASDICVAENDRMFAATELGVQCIMTSGVVDVILPLPNDAVCDKAVLSGDMLYVKSGKKVWCRQLNIRGREEGVQTQTVYNLY